MSGIVNFCNKIIEISFYALFFLVPLVFAGNTSELFEFNKMWVAFVLAIFIGGAWLTKMTLERKVVIQRTPLDIPILLFLLSQIISTIFSLDQHVSWWGYYSRFNGGLLSTICYILFYYAFVSNLNIKHIYKSIIVSLTSGLIVALWGFPSHFGYDPTCFVFRGTLDTTCWTEAFRPTVRVFSTLGQPAWLAAYMAALLPLAIAYFMKHTSLEDKKIKFNFFTFSYLAITILFYLNLVFTNTRAGFYAFVAGNLIFWAIVFIKKIYDKKTFLKFFLIVNALFFLSSFFFGTPVTELRKYTLPDIMKAQQSTAPVPTQAPTAEAPVAPVQTQQTPPPAGETGITDSGNIRIYVWQGAIDAWKSNVLFGTGVETFAFAYYKFRPVGHNLTSEWDYLYNKAHNEYLNYLTTTGLFGLGTYLAFLAFFVFFSGKWVLAKTHQEHTSQSFHLTQVLTVTGLVSGWVTILISNFFGFSVVIMNIYLFIIPLWVLMINEKINKEKVWEFSLGAPSHSVTPYQWSLIAVYVGIGIYFISVLATYWHADTKYALGYNLDRVNSYQDAYPLLLEAVTTKPNESVYVDEFSINLAVMATGFAQQNNAVEAQQFANNAIELSNQVTTKHPNNVVYWKNRVRMFYTLAQANPSQQLTYYQEALRSILVAYSLAPTDAKINYNLGVLYGQTGDLAKGIETLQQTIQMKPDYRDAYFALGLFLHEGALDQNRRIINPDMQQKAVDVYQYVLTNLNPEDQEVKKTLEDWAAGKN